MRIDLEKRRPASCQFCNSASPPVWGSRFDTHTTHAWLEVASGPAHGSHCAFQGLAIEWTNRYELGQEREHSLASRGISNNAAWFGGGGRDGLRQRTQPPGNRPCKNNAGNRPVNGRLKNPWKPLLLLLLFVDCAAEFLHDGLQLGGKENQRIHDRLRVRQQTPFSWFRYKSTCPLAKKMAILARVWI